MQYSCVAFILLSPVVMLGFIATVEIDYLNWKLIDEPEIGEPLIYHFIGPLSSYKLGCVVRMVVDSILSYAA